MSKISEIMLLQQIEQPILVIESQTDINHLSQVIGKSFIQIAQYLNEEGILLIDLP